MRALTLHQPWAQLMVWGLKNIETLSWAAPRNLIGQRVAIHAGKRKPRPTEWNIEVQRVVLRRVGSSHAMPMGAVVATAKLIECMQVMGEPDSRGIVTCRGFGELGDELAYDATSTTDLYGDFSVGRWLWVFHDLRRVEPVSTNGRQGVWTLPAVVAAEMESG
ncbi:MAG: ASCH domain-containing protein [Dehalococcoidia bacterium]|nr:ASCH domain-containing protein [Dehalococcoidia bacterium]